MAKCPNCGGTLDKDGCCKSCGLCVPCREAEEATKRLLQEKPKIELSKVSHIPIGRKGAK